jgi:hypothetical protein
VSGSDKRTEHIKANKCGRLAALAVTSTCVGCKAHSNLVMQRSKSVIVSSSAGLTVVKQSLVANILFSL